MIYHLPASDTQFRTVDRLALGEDLCDQLSAYWFDLFDRAGSVPERALFDPSEIQYLLPQLILLDVLEDGDLRYRLLGTDIDRLTRRPYTGKRVSEISCQGPDSRIRRLYRPSWTGCARCRSPCPISVQARYATRLSRWRCRF